MSRTQEIEKYYYKKFASAYGMPEAYEISDKPDISTNIEGKQIGIEITNFYLSSGSDLSSEQRQAPIRKRVINNAQSSYKGRPIEATISFNTIEEENGLAEKIANWLSEEDFYETGSVCIEKFKHIPELRFVYVYLDPEGEITWRNSQVYSISNTSPEALQNIIVEKEEKFKAYKPQDHDEMWLLIVIDFINFGMDQEPHNVDYSSIKVKKFDKVILYRTAYDTIIQFEKN